METPAFRLQEQLTAQFYEWEVLGRGWMYASEPIQLEPPFTPFFGHYIQHQSHTEDGVSHTFFSSIASLFRSQKQSNHTNEVSVSISYTPFPFDEEGSLICHTLNIPRNFETNPTTLFTFLTMLSYVKQPMSMEIHAVHKKIKLCIICRDVDAHYIEIQLKTYFPVIGISSSLVLYDDVLDPQQPLATVDFGLEQEFMRPINKYQSKQPDILTGILSTCQHLSVDEKVIVQVLFNGVVNSWAGSIIRSVSNSKGKPFFENAPEMLLMAKEKTHTPLFAATLRIAVQAVTFDKAYSLLDTLCFAIRTQAVSAGNSLIPLVDDSYSIVQRAQDIVFRQSHRMGMLLNLEELALFCHFPSYCTAITKLYFSQRTTKAVPSVAVNHPYLLGINVHNGKETPVTVSIEQRTKHTHLIGSTGTGKSTLMVQMVMQDVVQGNGIALFDPHGDLIEEVIGRIPSERIKDVILIDPADIDYPVGINLLQAHNDIEKEILSSDLVASFRKLSTSWGDQMNAVLGNAILVFLESNTGGTLHDLRRFLVEKEFRNHILSTVSDPAILYYWQKEYPLLKTNSIGPILTRLDTFLRPKILRNIVIQPKGIDFAEVLSKKHILLVKLSQGLIGTENSFILGSLILSKIHQAAFARQYQGTDRSPYFIYIDEFQHFVTPSVKDMLSGVRKYNIGLILSHQELQQIQREDADILHAVLANVGIRVVFRTGESDAKKLAEGFSSFDVADLLNLGKGEAVVRIEQPQYDCSLDTLLPDKTSVEAKQDTSDTIKAYSRSQYALPKDQVEQIFLEVHPIQQNKNQEEQRFQFEKEKQSVVTKPATESVQNDLEMVGTEKVIQQKLDSAHRYLQMLIKRMAESKGYVVTLEAPLSEGGGTIDLVLARDGKRIAVEVSLTTDAQWEVHNIEKCIHEGYDLIVSIAKDTKNVGKIKKLFENKGLAVQDQNVLFLTPDALFTMFDEQPAPVYQSSDQVIKGYRVKVSYDTVSQEEQLRKRSSIAKVIAETMRKQKNDK